MINAKIVVIPILETTTTTNYLFNSANGFLRGVYMYYNKNLGEMVGNVVSSIRGILFDIFFGVPFPKTLEKYHTIIYNITQQCNSAINQFCQFVKKLRIFCLSDFYAFLIFDHL